MSRVPHQDPFSASLLEGIHLPRHPSPYAASSPAVSTINNEVFGSSTVKPSMKKTYKKRKPPEGSQSASSSVKSSTLKNGGSNDEGNKENMNPLVAKPLFQKDQHCGRKSVSIVSPLMPKPPLLAVRQDLRHGVHALASAPKSHESMSSMFFSGVGMVESQSEESSHGQPTKDADADDFSSWFMDFCGESNTESSKKAVDPLPQSSSEQERVMSNNSKDASVFSSAGVDEDFFNFFNEDGHEEDALATNNLSNATILSQPDEIDALDEVKAEDLFLDDDFEDQEGDADYRDVSPESQDNSAAQSDEDVGEIPGEELDHLFEEYLNGLPVNERAALIQLPSSSPSYATSPSGVFSADQLLLLRIQMQQSVQLTSQAYIVEKEIRGSEADETRYWKKQLNRMLENRNHAVQKVGQGSYHDSPVLRHLQLLLSCSSPTPDKISTLSREFRKSVNYQLTERERKEVESRLLRDKKKVLPFIYPAPLFEKLDELIHLGGLSFDTKLLPRIYRTRRPSPTPFHSHEDALLVRGLISFGCSDISCIQAHCLPARSIADIQDRIHCLTTRKIQDNSLKSIYLRPFKPLTIFERDFLRQGIHKFGKDFKRQALETFQRPTALIKAAWSTMEILKEVSILWPEESVEALRTCPVSKFIAPFSIPRKVEILADASSDIKKRGRGRPKKVRSSPVKIAIKPVSLGSNEAVQSAIDVIGDLSSSTSFLNLFAESEKKGDSEEAAKLEKAAKQSAKKAEREATKELEKQGIKPLPKKRGRKSKAAKALESQESTSIGLGAILKDEPFNLHATLTLDTFNSILTDPNTSFTDSGHGLIPNSDVGISAGGGLEPFEDVALQEALRQLCESVDTQPVISIPSLITTSPPISSFNSVEHSGSHKDYVPVLDPNNPFVLPARPSSSFPLESFEKDDDFLDFLFGDSLADPIAGPTNAAKKSISPVLPEALFTSPAKPKELRRSSPKHTDSFFTSPAKPPRSSPVLHRRPSVMDSSPYKFRPFQHHPSSHSKLNILPAPPGSTPNFNGRPPLSNIGQSMATPSSSAMRDVKTMVGSSGSVNIFRGRGTVQVQVKPKHDEKKHTEVIKPPILPRISPRKTIVVDKKGGKSPPYSSPTVFIKGDPSHAILQRHLARTAGLVNKTSKPRKGRKNDEVIDLSSPPKLTTSKTFAKLSESFDNVASSPPRPSPSKTAGRQSANLSVSLSPWKISPKTSLQDALKENDDARREEKAKAQTETNPSTTLAVRNVPSKAHKKRKHEVIAHDDKQGEGRVLRKRVDHGLIDHVYKTRRSGRLLAEALAGRNRLRDLI